MEETKDNLKFVGVLLREGQIQEIDREAKQKETSRCSMVRQIVNDYLSRREPQQEAAA